MSPSSTRPLLPLLVVVSVLAPLAVCTQGHQQNSVCRLTCCEAEPNCTAALHVACRCRGLSQMYLGKGDLPSTVQSISISGATKVTISESAVVALPALVRLELMNIDVVELLPRSLALEHTSVLRKLQLENVRVINVSKSALSGSWDSGAAIELYAIAELHIQRNAFSFQSSHPPTLSIGQVSAASVAFKGIAAPIAVLSLAYVNMTECHAESLGKNVSRVDMEHVKITELKQRCIVGYNNATRLSMKSCVFGAFNDLAVTGEFDHVLLSGITIATVGRNGLMLKTTGISLKNSQIYELLSHGLNITASDRININNVSVSLLREHGLIDIRTTNDTARHHVPVRIHDLKIDQTEQGSLKLAEGINASLLRLSVRSPEPAVCPTETWVRWLTGTDDSQQLSILEQQMARQLHRSWLCPDGAAAASAEETSSGSQETSGGSQEIPGHHVSSAQTWRQPTNPDELDSARPASADTSPVSDTPDGVTTEWSPAKEAPPEPTDAFRGTAGNGQTVGDSQEASGSKPTCLINELLERRLKELEKAVDEISVQNDSRTIREIVAFTALVLYFVFKAFRWMESTEPLSNKKEEPLFGSQYSGE